MTFYLRFAVCLLLSTSMFISSTPSYAGAEVPPEGYINEIFFDPGGDGVDARDEYIELRGTPNALLDNHYLLIIENELDEFGIGDAGIVENLFDLSGRSFGENGFLLLRQKFSRYTPEQINPLATDLVNDGPNLPGPSFPGYGDGEDSTIGASDLNTTLTGPGEGTLENSGFTAFLIRNDSGEAPVLGLDIDEGNDGLDMPTLQAGWTVLDGVGVFSEFDETENGRLYAQVNFGSEDPIFPLPSGFEPKIEPGAEFYLANHEIEYIGRWGNSTGQTVADWHASNLTDNPSSGSTGVSVQDWRQSADPHPANVPDDTPPPQPAFVESSFGVPYGTRLTDTLGSPNFRFGDYDKDGHVTASDYTVWRDTLGTAGNEQAHPAADPNHDFLVDQADYQIFVDNYQTVASQLVGASTSTTIPEPATIWLLILAGLAPRCRRHVRLQ